MQRRLVVNPYPANVEIMVSS